MKSISALMASPVRSTVKRACACGCGRLTGRTWAPGHDAQRLGALLRDLRSGEPAKVKSASAELVKRGWAKADAVRVRKPKVEAPPAA